MYEIQFTHICIVPLQKKLAGAGASSYWLLHQQQGDIISFTVNQWGKSKSNSFMSQFLFVQYTVTQL